MEPITPLGQGCQGWLGVLPPQDAVIWSGLKWPFIDNRIGAMIVPWRLPHQDDLSELKNSPSPPTLSTKITIKSKALMARKVN